MPVRANNWAWFTAVNTAARMVLKDKFDEFSFNQSEMFEDLKALNGMHAGNGLVQRRQARSILRLLQLLGIREPLPLLERDGRGALP